MPSETTNIETTPAQTVPEPVQGNPAPSGTTTPGNGSEGTVEPSGESGFWPGEWRERMSGGDEKMLKHLQRFASPEGVYKKWRYYETQRGDGRLKPTRPETDNAEELAAWRKEVGAPDTPDGYLSELPAEINVSDADKAALKEVFDTMHAEGVPTGQAKAIVAKYYEMVAKGEEARAEVDRQTRMRAEDALRSEWGADYRANLNAIGILMESEGSQELFQRLNEARFSDGTKLADDPSVLTFLASVARGLHPDGGVIVSPAPGMTRSDAIQSEIAQLENEMRDARGRDPGGYWNNDSKQSRYRELITVRERMASRGR